VQGGEPIAVCLQSISGRSAVYPLVAFYNIHLRKRRYIPNSQPGIWEWQLRSAFPIESENQCTPLITVWLRHSQCTQSAIAEVNQCWSVTIWVTKNLFSSVPPCFRRYVKPLVPTALFVAMAPTNPHCARVIGYGLFSLYVIHFRPVPQQWGH
jgi:hypothetical protein